MSKTIVLIHGAWLNAQSWKGLQGPLRSPRLHRHRPVVAARRPLSGGAAGFSEPRPRQANSGPLRSADASAQQQ